MSARRGLLPCAVAVLAMLAPASAGSAQDTAAQVPSAIEQLLANRTTNPRRETAQQPDPTMVEAAVAQGLRTDGFYHYPDTMGEGKDAQQLTNYFRFCRDGWVTHAVVTGGLDVAALRSWLTCEPLNRQHNHGALRVDGTQFTLIMTTAPQMPAYRGEIDYWGQVASGTLSMHVRSRIRDAITYMKVQTRVLRFAPFEPVLN